MFVMPDSEHNCPQLLLAGSKGTESSDSALLDSFWSQTCGLGEAPKQEEVQSLATKGQRGPPTRLAEGRRNCSTAGVPKGRAARTSKYQQNCLGNKTQGWGVCPELCQEGNDGQKAGERNSGVGLQFAGQSWVGFMG